MLLLMLVVSRIVIIAITSHTAIAVRQLSDNDTIVVVDVVAVGRGAGGCRCRAGSRAASRWGLILGHVGYLLT